MDPNKTVIVQGFHQGIRVIYEGVEALSDKQRGLIEGILNSTNVQIDRCLMRHAEPKYADNAVTEDEFRSYQY